MTGASRLHIAMQEGQKLSWAGSLVPASYTFALSCCPRSKKAVLLQELLYNTQSVNDLDKLAASNVRLHKDSIFTHNDILGIKNLKQYFQV